MVDKVKIKVNRFSKYPFNKTNVYYRIDIPYNKNLEYYSVIAVDGEQAGEVVAILSTRTVRDLTKFKRSLKEAAASVGMEGLPELFPKLTFYPINGLIGQRTAREEMVKGERHLYAEVAPEGDNRVENKIITFFVM